MSNLYIKCFQLITEGGKWCEVCEVQFCPLQSLTGHRGQSWRNIEPSATCWGVRRQGKSASNFVKIDLFKIRYYIPILGKYQMLPYAVQ